MGKAKRKVTLTAKEKRNKFIAIVCTILVVALLGSLVVYSNLVTSGFFLRNTVAATSENYEVSNAVFSYFFNSYYQEFASTYGYYFSIDSSTSLKGQACSLYGDGTTWFDYFASSAKSTIANTLAFCEEANARGITLDEEDYKMIDDAIDSIKENAKLAGVSTSYYVHAMFGSGVGVKDIRQALELSALASKCSTAITEAYNYGEADYAKYVEENPYALLYAQYAAFDMQTSDTTASDEETAALLQGYLDRFAQAKNQDEFGMIAFDYLRNVLYADDEEMTDEKIREEVEALTVETSYTEGDKVSEWVFAAERQIGDVYTEVSEDKTSYTAYLLVTPAMLDNYNTVNIRHILLTASTYGSADAAKAKAEELLASFSGGADAFAALANEYSEDTGSNTNGGLYENVAKGEMVENFDAWIYEEGRKVGDTGIVESDYGYHVMFFDGEGDIAWHVQADTALKNAKYSEDSTAINKNFPTTFDDKAIFELDV